MKKMLSILLTLVVLFSCMTFVSVASAAEVKVNDIVINTTTRTIQRGKTYQLSVKVYPTNATNPAVKWTTSDKSVATVSSTGKVTAVGDGTCTITCMAKDGSNEKATCKVTVKKNVSSITIDKTKVEMACGSKRTLHVAVEPIDATNTRVKWTSSKPTVASVNSEGRVSALRPGTTTITCMALDGSGKSVSCEVTVVYYVKEIAMKEVKTVECGTTWTPKVSIYPGYATNKTLKWTSSDTSIAKVSSKGVITGVKNGTAYVTCTTTDGTKLSVTCKIKVRTFVEKITLNKTSMKMNRGDSYTLGVTLLTPSNASNKNITWTSSNTKVAKVSSTGKVTAVGDGTCTITATAADGQGATATCEVTVRTPVTALTLNKTSLKLEKGLPYQLKVTVAPSNATNRKVTWKSSNELIARVDEDGYVEAMKNGTCVISCISVSDKKVIATCNVTVHTLVSYIGLNEETLWMSKGKTFQAEATVSPKSASNQKLAWSSTDTSVATVDSTGLIKAVGSGSCHIFCKAKDGSGVSAYILVTVK